MAAQGTPVDLDFLVTIGIGGSVIQGAASAAKLYMDKKSTRSNLMKMISSHGTQSAEEHTAVQTLDRSIPITFVTQTGIAAACTIEMTIGYLGGRYF